MIEFSTIVLNWLQNWFTNFGNDVLGLFNIAEQYAQEPRISDVLSKPQTTHSIVMPLEIGATVPN